MSLICDKCKSEIFSKDDLVLRSTFVRRNSWDGVGSFRILHKNCFGGEKNFILFKIRSNKIDISSLNTLIFARKALFFLIILPILVMLFFIIFSNNFVFLSNFSLRNTIILLSFFSLISFLAILDFLKIKKVRDFIKE